MLVGIGWLFTARLELGCGLYNVCCWCLICVLLVCLLYLVLIVRLLELGWIACDLLVVCVV